MASFAAEQAQARERRGFRGTSENSKTVLCTRFTSAEGCRFGDRCNFAHGDTELRPRPPRVNAAPSRGYGGGGYGGGPGGSPGGGQVWGPGNDPWGGQAQGPAAGGKGGPQGSGEEYRLWGGSGRGGPGYPNGNAPGGGSGGNGGVEYKLWSGRGMGGYGGIGPGGGAAPGSQVGGNGQGGAGMTGQGNNEEYRLWGTGKPWQGNDGQNFNGQPVPAGASGMPAGAAAGGAWGNNSNSNGAGHNWTTHCAPDGHCYYYNTKTGVSQWETPAEMDFPPKN